MANFYGGFHSHHVTATRDVRWTANYNADSVVMIFWDWAATLVPRSCPRTKKVGCHKLLEEEVEEEEEEK